ncbi:hypothetical protein H6F88_08430 [Oculatella sp. FACHB-28]|uniref:hypothetical protein n=1 Tax=Oculatella sp. FACHB-28 TaxID=2692845 RepID=UPI001686C5C4|nr:hypothetical protein [Oculatella sp. FACHB-28]MBD2056042.1 hypothetical protein [Oculatella sp. FACHB-28]
MTATLASIHQSDVQSSLDIFAQPMPTAAQRASSALQVLLQEMYREPDEAITWQGSSLTGDGFPLEFAFTPADTDLRYTTEVGTPLIPPPQRLSLTFQQLAQLGHPVSPAMQNTFRQMQQGADLQYGAWVGGRHSNTNDSYKLYVEVPQENSSSLEQALHTLQIPRPQLSDRPVPLRMLGYHVTAHRLESYFRVTNATPYHLKNLMIYCGLGERAQELLELLEESYGYALRNKLPGGSIGISYSFSAEGVLPVFSLFLFARVLWGGDATIRHKFSQLTSRQNWDSSLYQQITQSLGDCNLCTTHHGMVGFIVPPDGAIVPSLGVRPIS